MSAPTPTTAPAERTCAHPNCMVIVRTDALGRASLCEVHEIIALVRSEDKTSTTTNLSNTLDETNISRELHTMLTLLVLAAKEEETNHQHSGGIRARLDNPRDKRVTFLGETLVSLGLARAHRANIGDTDEHALYFVTDAGRTVHADGFVTKKDRNRFSMLGMKNPHTGTFLLDRTHKLTSTLVMAMEAFAGTLETDAKACLAEGQTSLAEEFLLRAVALREVCDELE